MCLDIQKQADQRRPKGIISEAAPNRTTIAPLSPNTHGSRFIATSVEPNHAGLSNLIHLHHNLLGRPTMQCDPHCSSAWNGHCKHFVRAPPYVETSQAGIQARHVSSSCETGWLGMHCLATNDNLRGPIGWQTSQGDERVCLETWGT
jgi:hypothetical protein